MEKVQKAQSRKQIAVKCQKCGKEFEAYLYLSKWIRCECGGQAYDMGFIPMQYCRSTMQRAQDKLGDKYIVQEPKNGGVGAIWERT